MKMGALAEILVETVVALGRGLRRRRQEWTRKIDRRREGELRPLEDQSRTDLRMNEADPMVREEVYRFRRWVDTKIQRSELQFRCNRRGCRNGC